MAKLTKLEYLDIRDNAFSTLPAIVCSLTSLKEIDVQYCLLKDLPAKYVPKLKCNIRIKNIELLSLNMDGVILYCFTIVQHDDDDYDMNMVEHPYNRMLPLLPNQILYNFSVFKSNWKYMACGIHICVYETLA